MTVSMRLRTLRTLLLGLTAGLVVGLASLPAALPSAAQGTSDGTLYSRFGVGTLQTFGSAQVNAMGGAGTGLRSFNYTNFENPAAWSDQVLTRAAVGLSYENIAITDAQDNTSRLSAGNLNAVQFSFPILERRLGVGLAFQPYTRAGYRVVEEGYLTPDPTVADSVRFLIDHEGRGGLQQVMAGLGFRVHPNVSIGANVSVIFGIIEDARRTSFPASGNLYSETDLVAATRLAGVTGRLGVLVSPTSVFRDRDVLTIGATFTLPATLHGSRVRTLGASLDADTLGLRQKGSVNLPLGAGLGVSYRLDNRWTFAADAQYQPWSGFESDFGFPGYTPGGESGFTDRLRAGGGVELLPAGSDLLAPFLQRVIYRLGFYYDQLYVSPAPGTDIRALAVTGGLSLPALIPGTHLDLNMEVGTRGTTDSGLVRDVYYKLTATVNIGERWFQKQKLR